MFEDEASFRQDPSLYQTWAPRGEQPRIPTTGQRNTQRIFGAVTLQQPRFHFPQDTVFNGATYAQCLQQLAESHPRRRVILIHENVAYHHAPEVQGWLLGIAGSRWCRSRLTVRNSTRWNRSGITRASRPRTTATTQKANSSWRA